MPLVGGGRLPLAFIGAGLVWLALGAGALALQPGVLLLPAPHPHVAALVHLWLPGFLLSICLGSVYQLMPVVLGTPLRLSLPAAWTHWLVHTLSVPVLVGGFFTGRFAWVAVGGLGVTLGLGLLSGAILRTFAASTRRDAAAWCFPFAGAWLAANVLVGVLLALNRHHPFLPWSILDLLRAHAHLGLVGFFLSLLQGVTFQLVPMFTMGTLQRPRLIWAGLGGTQLGLLLLAPGLAWDAAGWSAAGALLLLGALTCTAVALHATLRTRRRRKLETGLRAFVAGAGCLGLAGLVGIGTLLSSHGFNTPWAMVYGLLIIGGGLSLTVLGMLCKIMPFLVWMRAYGSWVGKRPVPVATTLASPRLERLWLGLHVASLLTLSAGLLLSQPALVALGTWLLAAGIALLLSSFTRVALHLRPAPLASAATAVPSPL